MCINRFFIIALCLTSCVPALKNTRDVTVKVPEHFSETPTAHAGETSTAPLAWNKFLKDPALHILIETGLKNNQDLQILSQEISVANNEVMARGGEIFPKVGIGAAWGVDKPSRYTSQGLSDDVNGAPNPMLLGRVGLTASWEIDIFKKLRNATKAAYLNYLSSVETRKFMVTQLVAEMATAYFELQAFDAQLELLKSYVDILKTIKKMASLQQLAGRVTTLPVARFEAEVLKNESRIYELEQKITVTQNRLNVLAGRFPEELKRDSRSFLKVELAKLETGIPASLLENRPDIKAAEYDLESAKLNVQSTKARFYPSLTIDAGVGFSSFNVAHFVSFPESLLYSAAGSLTAPILNRQAIKAAYLTANSKQIEAVYRYEQTLVTAFAEVVNQMNMIKNFEQSYEFKSKQVDALNGAVDISNTLFKAARVDYVETLLTRRDALETQMELIETKKQLLGAHINLYKALGGGWKDVPNTSAGSTG